ncbi:MAG TPA: FAD-dependent oxidoreductase [Jiangellaceae bacterium]
MPRSPSDSVHDVAVVGGGPAGLAAASAAAAAGCRVVLLDAGAAPGGQFWRQSSDADAHRDGLPRDRTYARLCTAVRSVVTYHPRRTVWTIVVAAGGFTLHTTGAGGEGVFRVAAVVLATGAFDRQLPFPGWDLPGVFTAGGVQALLKEHGVVPGRRIVVAGTGPFLLPVAVGLVTAGAPPAGVFEANRPGRWPLELLSRPGMPSLRHMHTDGDARDLAGCVAARAAEAARYVGTLARHGVRVRARHAVIAAHGTDRVRAVTVARLGEQWTVVPGSARTVECDTVAVGWGFTPQVELATGLGAATRLDADGSLVVTVDRRQRTSVPGVFTAGEINGVGGAELGVVEGEIAGRAAAAELGRAVSWPDALLRRRYALLTFARAVHRVYPVRNGWRNWLRPDTVVCRCEEVTAAEAAAAVDELGARDERSVKLLTRTGMGWCQGRMCGFAVGRLVADGAPGNPRSVAERPLATPVRLGELANGPGPAAAAPGSADDPAEPGQKEAG